MGPYNDPQADFGAVVSAQSKQAVLQAIENCIKDGGELLLDWARLAGARPCQRLLRGPSCCLMA